MTDPWSSPPPRRQDLRASRGAAGTGVADDGFESGSDRLRRVLRTRPAEPRGTVLLRSLAGTFRSDEYPQLLAEAAAGAQIPVTTGRRIAVLGTRGGSGRTTVTALLARVYASLRQDGVAAVDATFGRGTLGLRLGLDALPDVRDVSAALGGRLPADRAELGRLLAAAEDNLWAAGSGPGSEPFLPEVSSALSRYCPITVVDAGSPLTAGGILATAHAAVFVAPASVAGLADARWHARAWAADPQRARIPLLTVLGATDAASPFNAAAEARRLEREGTPAMPLSYDRHLAGGVELDPSLLSRAVRLEATGLAAGVLRAAAGTR
ncbi:hypothetical protein KIH31_08025 [Paenarthrobacter sp. DKR-5]|uniref:hypothetical protein n=1 Tax=Paenarthrobacter sp. DKR-5 TaxID=2835535 RepID=UPI001BDC0860|nr:hypothetical protein [Paenarthrobacter sp. DKR-5]MBT1002550.1 hypothetical protein [Paenarthrobacter sp. DKR-5]